MADGTRGEGQQKEREYESVCVSATYIGPAPSEGSVGMASCRVRVIRGVIGNTTKE